MRKLAEEAFVVEFIKNIRKKDRGMGGGTLWYKYKDTFGEEHSVGYNRFYDIIDKYNLKVRKKKRRIRTTNSDHNLPLYPNLVKELIPLRPNQLWVSDITYMLIYLSPNLLNPLIIRANKPSVFRVFLGGILLSFRENLYLCSCN
jgi:hypothetical protein